MSSDRRAFLAGAGRMAAAAGAAGLAGGPLATAAGGESKPGRRPNVLILMTDQERHQDRLPEDLPTPVRCWLDQNGTRLDRFQPSSMACSPSRACYWTGMYAPQQGIYGTFVVGTQFTMDPAIPTIGDLFKEIGYRTAFFGKWHLSFPGEPPTNLEAALDTVQGNPLRGYGFDDSAISPPADVGGYNDGYTNDPIWTGQAVHWLREHADDEEPWLCVLSLLNPHDIQFYPRGFAVDWKRPDYGAEPEPLVLREPDAGRQAVGPGSLPQRGVRHRRHRSRPRERPGLLARAAQHLLRPDRRHRRDARGSRQGGDGQGGARRHGDRADRRPRRARVRPPPAEQGRDHLRRAEPRPVHRRLPQALPPWRAVAGARRGGGPRPDAARARRRGRSGRPLAVAARRQPRLGAREPRLAAGRATRRSSGSTSTRSTTSAPPSRPAATSAAIFDGRYKFARYVAVADQHFAGHEFVEAQEYELYDTWNDPFEIRNLANDPGYAQLKSELLDWLYEREKLKYRPVDLPAYGPHGLITHLPEPPSLGVLDRGIPNPWPKGKPGHYLKVPGHAADAAAVPLRGRACRRASTRPGSRPARTSPAFFCELGP